MTISLRSLVAKLPAAWQRELRRMHFTRQIGKGRFISEEPEFDLLPSLVAKGDWVIDIGANVGHYTARLSKLVGQQGRVIAFEPIPETFAVLAWNLQTLGCSNVTLINTALSDNTRLTGMSMPTFENGMPNYYQAHIDGTEETKQFDTLTLSLDDFTLHHPISLIKIDVEGHEASVLNGMKKLLSRHHPTLILETESSDVQKQVEAIGYNVTRIANSPNVLCRQII